MNKIDTIGRDVAREAAIGSLQVILPTGSTLYAIVRSVSRSGALRRMDFYAIRNGEPVHLNGRLRDAMGWKTDRDGHVEVYGGGTDMVALCAMEVAAAVHGDEGRLYGKAL